MSLREMFGLAGKNKGKAETTETERWSGREGNGSLLNSKSSKKQLFADVTGTTKKKALGTHNRRSKIEV
jgi:hypothetical protein